MAASDSGDLFHLCEENTSKFLPDELSDFKNEGKLRLDHTLEYPEAYRSEKNFGILRDSSSTVRTDEFTAAKIEIVEEGPHL